MGELGGHLEACCLASLSAGLCCRCCIHYMGYAHQKITVQRDGNCFLRMSYVMIFLFMKRPSLTHTAKALCIVMKTQLKYNQNIKRPPSKSLRNKPRFYDTGFHRALLTAILDLRLRSKMLHTFMLGIMQIGIVTFRNFKHAINSWSLTYAAFLLRGTPDS